MIEFVPSEITDLPLRDIDLGTVFFILYVLVIAYLLVKAVAYILKRIAERPGQRRMVFTMLIPLTRLIIYVSALYLILQAIFNPTVSEIVALAVIFGAAVGFGLKDIFADILGGIVISFERPYQIGDKISAKGHYGEVVDIGLRATRILTPDDTLVSIPNVAVFSEATASSNAGKTEMMVVVDLFIDHGNDPELAMAILKDAVVTSKYVYVSPTCPFTILLEDFPFYKRVRAKAYVNDLRYEFEFRSEVTRRTWREFRQQGIAPPRLSAIPPDEQASD
ncbi:mechanosensitive ion channel [Methanoculleus sp. FWC-SCC1]|uniref:Mechanosensitive ion channel n=1 Tax=Methanoculleus frigidifontis TaxID=2584085 RepID=A0ABT8M646_9EURY|nr:mechanosensitive ion channel domain-containing protein [Methanoculleus sp. FWC-SCC1]MDN7023359.1 mechanosensitive ion channel [Methanoculleus sp. FWC-SCC1]